MPRILPLLCLLIALPARAAFGAVPERVSEIIKDQQQHGYASAGAAIARLQRASDVPGPDAPLDARLRYQTAILHLAMKGPHLEAFAQSMAALEQMATLEHCAPCRFETLLGHARQALNVGSPATARPWLDQAQRVQPAGDGEREGELLALQAATEGQDGQSNKAIELGIKASDLARAQGHVAEEVSLLAAMMGPNADLGDLGRAEAEGREALARATALNYVPVMALINLDLGHVYSLKNDRPRQLIALTEALRLSENAPDLIDVKLLSLNNLADYYLEQPGRDQRVLELARRADALAQSTRLEHYRPAPLANIGIALSRTGHVAEGIDKLKQAIAIADRHGMNTYVIGITMELVNIHEKTGHYRDALIELRKVNRLEQQVTRQGREKAVLELQEKFAAERKNQEIRQLSAENALHQAEVAAKTWQQRLWAALVALLVLGSVVLGRMIRRARTVNRQLAIANATLAEQSAIDPLTRAYNRRHCQELMACLQGAAAGRRDSDGKRPAVTGLLMLDADFFKHVNDTYGHAGGDAVLVAIVDRLRALLRQQDVVARWGGEEFLLVLPHTAPEQLVVTARRVLHAIGGVPVTFDGTSIPVTVSIGGACFPMFEGQPWEAALGLTDELMYQSKAGGRNRATCVTGISECAQRVGLASDLRGAQATDDARVEVIVGPVAYVEASAMDAT